MAKAKVPTRRDGTGYLILKSGVSKQVTWEVDVLHDGSAGKGIVRGDNNHLAAAAKDGCANLLVSADTTAAVAIDGCEDGEASFSVLLASSAPHTFRANKIEARPIVDGNRFLFEFSGADDERLFVIVPTIIMRDFLITLKNSFKPHQRNALNGASRFPRFCNVGGRRHSVVFNPGRTTLPSCLIPRGHSVCLSCRCTLTRVSQQGSVLYQWKTREVNDTIRCPYCVEGNDFRSMVRQGDGNWSLSQLWSSVPSVESAI